MFLNAPYHIDLKTVWFWEIQATFTFWVFWTKRFQSGPECRGQKPFRGQFEAKWKSGHNSVKCCFISTKFTWITHSYKGFPKLLWKLSSVYFSICQLNKLFLGPKSKYKNENSTTVFLNYKVKSKIWLSNQHFLLNMKFSFYPLCIIIFSFWTILRTF